MKDIMDFFFLYPPQLGGGGRHLNIITDWGL